ncbi:hypothetical protein Bbelb_357790 [Branchiostoma belcheri]|nr:hypothetical protein Bbelb_357790 [Branchiostoma belcheri]
MKTIFVYQVNQLQTELLRKVKELQEVQKRNADLSQLLEDEKPNIKLTYYQTVKDGPLAFRQTLKELRVQTAAKLREEAEKEREQAVQERDTLFKGPGHAHTCNRRGGGCRRYQLTLPMGPDLLAESVGTLGLNLVLGRSTDPGTPEKKATPLQRHVVPAFVAPLSPRCSTRSYISECKLWAGKQPYRVCRKQHSLHGNIRYTTFILQNYRGQNGVIDLKIKRMAERTCDRTVQTYVRSCMSCIREGNVAAILQGSDRCPHAGCIREGNVAAILQGSDRCPHAGATGPYRPNVRSCMSCIREGNVAAILQGSDRVCFNRNIGVSQANLVGGNAVLQPSRQPSWASSSGPSRPATTPSGTDTQDRDAVPFESRAVVQARTAERLGWGQDWARVDRPMPQTGNMQDSRAARVIFRRPTSASNTGTQARLKQHAGQQGAQGHLPQACISLKHRHTGTAQIAWHTGNMQDSKAHRALWHGSNSLAHRQHAGQQGAQGHLPQACISLKHRHTGTAQIAWHTGNMQDSKAHRVIFRRPTSASNTGAQARLK